MEKEIVAEGMKTVMFGNCLLKECKRKAIFIHIDDYLGAQVTWCMIGHVVAFDPELDDAPKLVHSFTHEDKI